MKSSRFGKVQALLVWVAVGCIAFSASTTASGAASLGAGACGDGVVGAGEACDDGNTATGDGCSATCGAELYGTNVLANPEFDLGTSAWNFFTTGSATFSATAGQARVAIAVQGSNVQLFQTGIALQGNTRYRLRFVGRNTGGTDLQVVAFKHTSPYTFYGLFQEFDLTPQTRSYDHLFTTTAGDKSDARLMVWLAPYDQAGSDYFFDSFALQKVVAWCGNGVLESGEQCDDGNVVGGDDCSGGCRIENTCGNGFVEGGEQCDDGNTISGDSCQPTCQLPACGDGFADPGEACDDGNTTSGDGCQADCSDPVCGDAIVDPGEECDNGGSNSDTLPNTCRIDCIAAGCGDGVIDAGEQCDDGNTAGGDGCNATCQLPACGDNFVDPGEDCDDGNTTSGDGCQADCSDPACGDAIVDPGEQCDNGGSNSDTLANACRMDCMAAGCGDDVIDAGEQCDDGNTTSGDGCNSTCQLPACGDNFVDPGEDCDDGNTVSGDGCQADCTDPVCGDGVMDPGEQCDDGNTVSGDGCTSGCIAEVACGNGVRDPGEDCDDGNTVSGDGCTATCQGIVGDRFDAVGLDVSTWNFIDPVGDSSLAQSGGDLRIGVTEGLNHDAWPPDSPFSGSNDAPRVMQSADDSDFRLVTKFLSPLNEQFEGAGFLIEQDAQNWLRFDVYSLGHSWSVFAAKIVNNQPISFYDVLMAPPSPVPLYLRVTRSGDNWTFERSLDGLNWIADGPVVNHSLVVREVGLVVANFAFDESEAPEFLGSFGFFAQDLHCGDGDLDPGEECDDGNTAGGDDCSPFCQISISICGNAVLEDEEPCDDGNLVDGDGCSSSCAIEPDPCGDGTIRPGEACDDGNNVTGDGCSATCALEGYGPNVLTNADFSAGGSPWFFHSNGLAAFNVIGGEAQIDINAQGTNVQLYQINVALKGNKKYRLRFDGRNTGGDDVLALLQKHTAPYSNYGLAKEFDLTPSTQSFYHVFTTTFGDKNDARFLLWMAPYDQPGRDYAFDDFALQEVLTECGNGTLDSGEECDDGNLNKGDGCSGGCRIEGDCGDGNVDSGEACDAGASNSDSVPNACRTDCSLAGCGDGVMDSGEACDDAGATADCDADCTLVVCGDGMLNPAAGEQCDDGNTTSGDGCNADCTSGACGDGTVDPGEQCDNGAANSNTAADACRTDCRDADCGDDVVDLGEQCDDGNTNDGDGCQANCLLPVCGDGIVDPGESCDDGNTSGGDGCSSGCAVEVSPCGDGFVGSGEACDDGNLVNDDGCSATCAIEQYGPNVLLNPSFASGPSPWSFYSNASAAFNVVGGEAQISITTQGTNVQLYQFNVAISGNARYRLRFRGRNAGGNDVQIALHSHVSPYSSFGLFQQFDLTPTSQNFSTEFQTTAGNKTNGRFNVWMAPFDVAGNAYTFDDFVLERVEVRCGNGVVEGPEQCDDGNLLGGDGCSPGCVTQP